MKKQPSTTHFLNVDLELTAPFDLQPLADALEPKMNALYVGRRGRTYFANLESSLYPRHWNPDRAIREECKCVRSLSPSARKLWTRLKTRDFSIGIAAGVADGATFLIEAETVKAAAAVGARISIVVYPPEEFPQKLRNVGRASACEPASAGSAGAA